MLSPTSRKHLGRWMLNFNSWGSNGEAFALLSEDREFKSWWCQSYEGAKRAESGHALWVGGWCILPPPSLTTKLPASWESVSLCMQNRVDSVFLWVAAAFGKDMKIAFMSDKHDYYCCCCCFLYKLLYYITSLYLTLDSHYSQIPWRPKEKKKPIHERSTLQISNSNFTSKKAKKKREKDKERLREICAYNVYNIPVYS